MNRIVIIFLAAFILVSCSSKFSKILKSKDVEYKYKMAEQFYAKKDYSKAQVLYEDIFQVMKGTPRYEDMYYKFAYSYYYQKDYSNAENLFKNFLENFPSSNKLEEIEYMRAYSFFKESPKVDLDQTNTNKTMQLMQVFINGHPGSKRVLDATEIIDQCREKLEEKEFKAAQLYLNLGYYKAAAVAFGNVSDNFPDSKKADLYKYQVVVSYFKYAEMSYEEKQQERYGKVLIEADDFLERYNTSKYVADVNKYKTASSNYLNNTKK